MTDTVLVDSDRWSSLFAALVTDREGFELAVRIVPGVDPPMVRVVLRHAAKETGLDVDIDSLDAGFCELVLAMRGAGIGQSRALKRPVVLTPPSRLNGMQRDRRLSGQRSLIQRIADVMRKMPQQTARAQEIAARLPGVTVQDITATLCTYSKRKRYVEAIAKTRVSGVAWRPQILYKLTESTVG